MMAGAVTARLPSGTAYSNILECFFLERRALGLAPVSCSPSYLRLQGLIRGGMGQFTCERHSSFFLNPKLQILVNASLRSIDDLQGGRDFKPEGKKNKKTRRNRNAATGNKVWGIQSIGALNVDHVYATPAKEAWTKGPFDFMAFLSKLQPVLETYPSLLTPRCSTAFAEDCRGILDDLSHGLFEGTFPETVLRSQSDKLRRFFDTTSGLKDVPAGIWQFSNVHDQESESVASLLLNLWGQVAELRSLTPPDPWSRAYGEQLTNLAVAQTMVNNGLHTLDRARNAGDCSERSLDEYGAIIKLVSLVIDVVDRQYVANIANDMVAHLRSSEKAPSGSAKAAAAVIRSGVIACIKIENQEGALNAARAALDGGITVLELTMTVPGALESVETLVAEYPDAVIGVGTVFTAEEAEAAALAGAHFVMSPIFNEEILDVQNKLDVLYIPGAMTPTEIWTAHRKGCSIVKVFPTSEATLRALRRPLARLTDPPLSLVASHGIREEDIGRYLGDRLASAVVLSDAIFGHGRAAADITAAARRVVALAKTHTNKE